MNPLGAEAVIASRRKTKLEKSEKTEQKQDPNLDRDAWDLHKALSELLRIYQFRDRNRICCHDVSVTQCYAVNALLAHGSMTLTGLAGELFLDKSTASRVVDSLERKGYVSRSTDPDDGRAVQIRVTKSGRRLHDAIEQELVDGVKELISDFDPDVRQATTRLVASLARAAGARFAGKPKGSRES